MKKPENFIKEKQQLSTDYIDNCKIKQRNVIILIKKLAIYCNYPKSRVFQNK